MYADDTTLVSTLENFGDRNNAKEIQQNINKEIYKITTWLHSNKLRLNVSKSKFMIFFKHPKVIPKLNISVNDNQIDQVDEFNFLGITIDQSVTWKTSGVRLPSGSRPAKMLLGQLKLFCGWLGWPAIILYKCYFILTSVDFL